MAKLHLLPPPAQKCPPDPPEKSAVEELTAHWLAALPPAASGWVLTHWLQDVSGKDLLPALEVPYGTFCDTSELVFLYYPC